MAAGTKITGKDGIIELTYDGNTEEIPCLISWTLDESDSYATDNDPCMLSNGDGGSDAAAASPSRELESTDWTISTEHYFQTADDAGATEILETLPKGATVAVKLYPNKKTTGSLIYSGDAKISSNSRNATSTEKIKQSLTFEATGTLSRTRVA